MDGTPYRSELLAWARLRATGLLFTCNPVANAGRAPEEVSKPVINLDNESVSRVKTAVRLVLILEGCRKAGLAVSHV